MTRWRLLFATYVVLAGVTGVPAFAKHTAHPLLLPAAYTAALVAIGFWIVRAAMVRRDPYRQRFVAIALALSAALALANVVLYPGTRLPAAHSSAPDALIDSATRLVSGQYPYARLSFDSTSISPGPGWIALHAPLSVSGLIWLLVPLHLAMAAIAIAGYSASAAALFAFVVLALPAFLQMSIVGHDLFAAGCAMVVVTLAVHDQVRTNGRWLVFWALAAAVVATARVPFAIFVVALGAAAIGRDRRAGMTFLGVAALALVAIHAAFYAWGHALGFDYQPLHVFGRAGNGAGPTALVLGVILWTAVTAWLWRQGTTSPAEWLVFTWAAVGLPFVAVGFGELINVSRMDWSNWEGKVYVGFSLPLLAAGLLLNLVPSMSRTQAAPTA